MSRLHRRQFLRQTTSAAAVGLAPYVFTADAEARQRPRAKNDRFGIGAIGMRYQGSVITEKAQPYGDVVAICDVDRQVAEKARKQFGDKAELYEEYRRLLERKDLDVLFIGTPDHWHTKMVVDACRAGLDVYVEKPLTLTVDEGKLLTEVVEETGRVVQVGSWQRSDHRFRLAAEIARGGRLGQIKRVNVVLGKNKTGGPFQEKKPPPDLNWNLWQGQTAAVPYMEERCHYTFRWWYEYSGGQMTDWGAHHLDIGQWAIGEYPIAVAAQAKLPNIPDGYNVAVDYAATYRYPSGAIMTVKDTGQNGVLITGTKGRIFVNRGRLTGKPVEELPDNPLPREKYRLYAHDNLQRRPRAGKLDAIINHMGNFFDCVGSRQRPISDVWSQHRSVTTCHIANISMRLGRPLRWDPQEQRFASDDEANAWLQREQREGFQIA